VNPFNVERCRQILAINKNYNVLKQLYSKYYTEIKNINTPKMWDEKFQEIGGLKDQDGMTRDRVKISYQYLPSDIKKVLDIGAGAGFLEEFLFKKRNISIYANDFSNISIEKLGSKFKGNFEKQSFYKLKYPNNFFDCVFLLEVLEHIPPNKVFAVLRSVRKLLTKQGYLIVSVPMNESLERMETNPNGHVRDYTESLIKAELELSGFKILDREILYAFKNLYSVKKLLSKLLKNRWKPNNIIIKTQASTV